jgi:uncharacterized protein
MKIELDTSADDYYRIDAYQHGLITVNGVAHTSSLIISPGKVIGGWPPSTFTDLATQHIEQIIQLNPEIIILGTGQQLYFPAPELIERIFELDIGFEVMDTGAACRCYNLLVSEKRNVAAGLIMIQG